MNNWDRIHEEKITKEQAAEILSKLGAGTVTIASVTSYTSSLRKEGELDDRQWPCPVGPQRKSRTLPNQEAINKLVTQALLDLGDELEKRGGFENGSPSWLKAFRLFRKELGEDTCDG